MEQNQSFDPSILSSWWFQPIYKICPSNWIISPGRGENKNVWNHHLLINFQPFHQQTPTVSKPKSFTSLYLPSLIQKKTLTSHISSIVIIIIIIIIIKTPPTNQPTNQPTHPPWQSAKSPMPCVNTAWCGIEAKPVKAPGACAPNPKAPGCKIATWRATNPRIGAVFFSPKFSPQPRVFVPP